MLYWDQINKNRILGNGNSFDVFSFANYCYHNIWKGYDFRESDKHWSKEIIPKMKQKWLKAITLLEKILKMNSSILPKLFSILCTMILLSPTLRNELQLNWLVVTSIGCI